MGADLGRITGWHRAVGVALAASASIASAQDQSTTTVAPAEHSHIAANATLPAFTPLKLMLNEELSSQQVQVGDPFTVTVLEDVVDNGAIVIPKGSIGHGEVTFASRKGGFGKPGIIGIALRRLELNGRHVELDGRYREEGRNNNGAVAATWFAVGIFSGFIKGRAGYIEKGRELRGRTGEPITYPLGVMTPAATPDSSAVADPAAAQAETINGGT